MLGEHQATRALGIRTYVSAAVRMSDEQSLRHAVCGQRTCSHTADSAEIVLQLFAKLIAQHVEREQLMQALQQRNEQLTRLALAMPSPSCPTAGAAVARRAAPLAGTGPAQRRQCCAGGFR